MGFNMFGRSYESVGNESADFCIKTKGKVKIKWGSKYIDLIKDGKINVNADFIFKVNTADDIGSKDGVYVTEDGLVFIKIDGVLIPIIQSSDDSDYVAYVIQDKKTGEQRVIAQKNIGLQFNTLEELTSSGVTNGIAFVVSENAIYKILNGSPEKLEYKLQNPITEPLVIKVSGAKYSLLIDGYFSSSGSGLMIGSADNGLFIYAESDGEYIEIPNILNFVVNDQTAMSISNTDIRISRDVIIDDRYTLTTNTVKSKDADKNNGFLMTIEDDGESYLYIDHIIARYGIDTSIHLNFEDFAELMDSGELVPEQVYTIDDFQNEWDIVDYLDGSDEAETEDEEDEGDTRINVFPLRVKAFSENSIYSNAEFVNHPEWTLVYDPMYRDELCTSYMDDEAIQITAKGRIIWMKDEYGNSLNYDFKHLTFYDEEKKSWFYTFSDDNGNDKSITGSIRNVTIINPIESIKRQSVPNTQSISYTIGGDAVNVILCDVEDFYVSSSISKLFADKTVDTGICKDINIVASEINTIVINGTIGGLNINAKTISNLTISSDSYNLDVLVNVLKEIEFESFSNSIVTGDTLESTKFKGNGNTISIKSLSDSEITLNISYLFSNSMTKGTFECDDCNIRIKTVDSSVFKCLCCKFNVGETSGSNFQCNYSSFSSEYINTSTVGGSGCKYDCNLSGFNMTSQNMNAFLGVFPETHPANVEEVNDPSMFMHVIHDSKKSVDRYIYLPSVVFKGMITMFSGSSADIPYGWHICDGTNGTPDLTGKFIKADTVSGNEGGDEKQEVAIEIKNMPIHKHSVQSMIVTTEWDGSHKHYIKGVRRDVSDNANDRGVLTLDDNYNLYTETGGGHTHAVHIPGSDTSEAGHGLPLEIKIEPKYYSLIFIMYIGL